MRLRNSRQASITGNSTTPHGYGLYALAKISQFSPSPLVILPRSTVSLATTANPYLPSIALSAAVNPASANSAPASPLRAAFPTPMLFDMLPRLSTSPADCVAAWPSAQFIRTGSSPISFPAAAAAPKMPQVAVMWAPRR